LSSQKVRTAFFHICGKNVLSAVWCNVTVFLVFSFRGNSELRKPKMAKLLSMNHHRAPRMDRWTIHGTVLSVTDCRYYTKSSGCHLNVNGSTPALTSHSTIMCS
jgi:hypothetical protein